MRRDKSNRKRPNFAAIKEIAKAFWRSNALKRTTAHKKMQLVSTERIE